MAMSKEVQQQVTEYDIKNPVAAWILASLIRKHTSYDSGPIDDVSLSIELCDKVFPVMDSDDGFRIILDQLLKAKYVAFSEVDKKKGYVVTSRGVIAFRRQISSKIEKLKDQQYVYLKEPRYEKVFAAAESGTELLSKVADFCKDNAPALIELIHKITPQ